MTPVLMRALALAGVVFEKGVSNGTSQVLNFLYEALQYQKMRTTVHQPLKDFQSC